MDCQAGQVNYAEFFDKLGVVVRPNDSEGLSSQIMDSNERDMNVRQSDHWNR
jgi:hypothetical protein